MSPSKSRSETRSPVAPAAAGQAQSAAYDGLLRAVRKLDLTVGREADALLAVEVGLSRGQFLILDGLAETRDEHLSQSQLAGRLGLTRAAVSRHVIDAAAAGLLEVTRAARSRREVEMTLTAEGRRRVTAGRAARVSAAAKTLVGLETAQIVAVTTLLTEVTERVAGQRAS